MKNYDLDNEETRDLVDGLFAWDNGCTDSGIHDDLAKEGLKKYFRELANKEVISSNYPSEFNRKFAAYIKEYFLSDKALRLGYGIEDVAIFFRWLGDEMGIDL